MKSANQIAAEIERLILEDQRDTGHLMDVSYAMRAARIEALKWVLMEEEERQEKEKMKWFEFDPENESLDECRDRRLMQMPTLSSAQMEVLKQCMHPVWDGNVASKVARSDLVEMGLVVRFNGWQIVSQEGLALLEQLGILDDRIVWTGRKR